MKKRKSSRLTYGEMLSVISDFGICIAQRVRGGEILRASHHDGDLWHARSKTFTEVKAAGMSAGALIVAEQLERQCRDSISCRNDYVIVFYRNCGPWGREKRRHLPYRIATSKARLQRFLLRNLEAVYIVPADLIQAIYHSDPSRIKRHPMGKKGYAYIKVYRKVSPADLRKLVNGNVELWSKLGQRSTDFNVRSCIRRVQFRTYPSILVSVYRIRPIKIPDDMSFDVASFGSVA